MSKITGYRSLFLAGAVVGSLLFSACGGTDHETMKAEQLSRWNLTRIAIQYQLAEQQYKVGDYEKCNQTLKDAFALKAKFAPVYILAAKVQIEQGNLQQAAEYLNTAMQINAREPEPYYLLGVIYQRWQKPEVACDYYNQAWTRKPDEALYMLATVEMEISLNRLDEAQKTLESKLVYFEQSGALRIALARIATLKNDYTRAARYYRDASTLMPDDKNVRRSYAEALFYAGEFADCLPMFEDMRSHADTPDRTNLLMMLGQTYMGLRRPLDARNAFQELIRTDSENGLAYLNLGKACIQTGDLGLALAAARKVGQIDPDNVEGTILTALVQQKMKRWSDAESTLAKAARMAPADSTVICMMGVSAQNLGQKAQAVAYYQRALQLNPKDTWAAELLRRSKPEAMAPAKEPAAESPAAANPQPANPLTTTPAAMARVATSENPKAP